MLRLKSLRPTRTVRLMPKVSSGNEKLRELNDQSMFERSANLLIRYAVTYVNTYGESPESEWSDAILIPLKCTAITVG